MKIDRAGKLVIVHQSGVMVHTRSVFSSTREGVKFVDQTYHLPDGSPYLQKPEKRDKPGELPPQIPR